jgi:hypothetical protein
MLKPGEYSRLGRLLLNATEEGPVESWLSRIACRCRLAGIQPCNINWNGSPVIVVHAVICEAERCSRIECLEASLKV